MSIIGATGRVAMGTARFFFLFLGALVFLLVLLVGWWLSRNVSTISNGQPTISWAVEPLASGRAAPLIATHPARGREEGWLFGGPGTGQAFAAMVLAEPSESGHPFTLNSPVFWQFDALRVLSPRIGGPHYEMTTRWGRFTGRDLIYRENDGRTRTCIAFRNAFETSEFALGGFYCAAGLQTADAGPLACMIDRLKLQQGERKSPALAYLAARATKAPTCSNSTFYPSGTRQVVRDRNGGVVRMNGRSGEAFPLWSN
ncbi:hypothetical protein [Bosea lathyri]|uniref:Uncharacterized protein n=1 Tax=Bosea lathyri TaxID=1036778 RepID=A0A1H6CT67_9HYPH|nr:hypothetical protein [Bosea lathyri]SEG75987.1 hypothetical protein SAMN04488115_11259 [Bosea lathyri]